MMITTFTQTALWIIDQLRDWNCLCLCSDFLFVFVCAVAFWENGVVEAISYCESPKCDQKLCFLSLFSSNSPVLPCFFPFFFFSSFQRSPHFKRRRKPYLKILWTKVSVSCRPCLRVFSSEFLTVSPQQTPRSLLYKHTQTQKKQTAPKCVFVF